LEYTIPQAFAFVHILKYLLVAPYILLLVIKYPGSRACLCRASYKNKNCNYSAFSRAEALPKNKLMESKLMAIKIRPLYDRIVIKRLEEERTSAGGIVIPDTATEKPIRGKVVAVGSGKLLQNGEMKSLTVKVNDEVAFGKYAGTELKVDGKEYLIMKEDDILAVIEK
jgi:chaperonin GroES